MKKHNLPLKLFSMFAAACLAVSPAMASTFSYNGSTYGTTAADITGGVKQMTDLSTVTLTAAAAAYETGTLYYSPSNHLLVIDGGLTSAKLSTILTGATYGTSATPLSTDNILTAVATGNAQLSNSVFYNMAKLQNVHMENGVTIASPAQSMFAGCTDLVKVSSASTITLPANIDYLFANDGNLTEIPAFNYSAVTSAKAAFANSAIEKLDLTTMTAVTNDTQMFTHALNLKSVKLAKKPSTASKWTSRWWFDADDDGVLDAGEPVNLASTWMSDATAMTYDHAYCKLTTVEEYTTANLGSMYYVEALSSDSMYKISQADVKMNGYCLNYIKDYPINEFFDSQAITKSEDWEKYLDTVGTHGDVTITRNLGNYENDVDKALRTILFYGYPNNGGGIIVESDTDADKKAYFAATQALLWNVLSGVEASTALTDAGVNNARSQEIFGLLAEKTYANYKSSVSTETGYLTLYSPDTDTVQNLVSGNYSVAITKYDQTGSKELVGAKLTLSTGATVTTDNTVASWTSTNQPYVINGLTPGKTYYLTETLAPAGYAIAEQIHFVAGGHNQKQAMTDKYDTHTITVKKMDDATPAARVAGAALTLTGTTVDGTAITAKVVTTTATEDVVFTGLLPGTYKVEETKTPSGYATADPINVSITASDSSEDETKYTFTMVDAKLVNHTITVKKVDDAETPARVAGAVLTLSGKKVDGTEVKMTKTTTATADVTFTNITPGTYTISETTTPAGYKTAADINVQVTNSPASEDATKYTYTMVDAKIPLHTITVKKIDDATTPARVAGAVLTLSGTGSDGKAITSVTKTTTDKEDVTFTDLTPGTYKITETTTPAGYKTAEAVTVTVIDSDVKEDAAKYTVTMIDKIQPHTVTVKKVDDATSPARVAGAVLTLTGKKADGTEIDKVTVTTTSSTDATFTNLLPGTYTVEETTVPTGYQKAANLSFTITATDPASDGTNYTYTMVDKKVAYGTLTFKKVDPKGTGLAGASFKILDPDGKEFTTFTTTSAATTVKNLLPDVEYKLVETSAPSGYEKAEDKTFKVTANATVEVKVTDDYSKHTLVIKKQDQNGDRVAGATITVTGNTLAGSAIETITFTTSGDSDKEISLYPGSYKVTETQVPEGYKQASAQSVSIGITDDTKTVTLVDQKTAETKSTTPAKTDTNKKDGTSTPSKAAKTGDEAPIGLLLALAAVMIGFIVAGVVIYRKKR